MVKIRVTQMVNGQQRAWFRSSLGRRIGTSMRATTGQMNWTTARQMMELAQYGIQLMLDRTAKAIGSDDQPMPPLKRPANAKSINAGYPAFKSRLGLQPIRDLRGPGGLVKTTSRTTGAKRYLRSGNALVRARATTVTGWTGARGHMLDDMRVNYVDDTRATIDISTTASRTKARANEARAPWWGWSPSDVKKLMAYAEQVFQMSFWDKVASYGLIGIGQFAGSVNWMSRARSAARRVA